MPRNQFVTLRESPAATWTSVNPVLAQGELGYETDTGKFKLGIDGSVAWNSLPYGGLNGPQSTLIIKSFGTGTDGNITISSGITTLTRDMYYTNLTINGTGQLNTNGYEIFISGTLDLSAAPTGAIVDNGPNGNYGTTGGGGSPASGNIGSVGTGGRGAAGLNGILSSTANGNNAANVNPGNGGNGANGGNAGYTSGSGGSGGTGGTDTAFPIRRYETLLLKGATLISGGAGGGSGAPSNGYGTQIGSGSGSGGNGGGVVAIYANTINRGTNTNTGIIQANGGMGGNGGLNSVTNQTIGGAGAGGGGGGGWIYLVYNTLTGSPISNALQANGGTGGNGGNISLIGALLIRKSTNNGTTWTNAATYAYPGSNNTGMGQPFAANGTIGIDNLNNVYITAYGIDSSSNQHYITTQSTNDGATLSLIDDLSSGINTGYTTDLLNNVYTCGVVSSLWTVRKSTDHGTTWSTVDSFTITGASAAEAMVTDSLGNIYVAGQVTSNQWIIRKSSDNGTTWATVDNYSPGGFTYPYNIGVDNLGNVFAVGAGAGNFWIVRKSTDQGATWNNVDTYMYPSGTSAGADSFTTDLSGNIYVGGGGTIGGLNHWIVRKSTDHGTTWSTVDDFVYATNNNIGVSGMTTDLLGNIYATGTNIDVFGTRSWITRKSTDNGITWSTIDNYVSPGGGGALGNAMTVDTSGNILVAGVALSINPSLTSIGGTGGNGGNGGTVTLINVPTSTVSSTSGSAGSSGNPNSGGMGGTGGAGNIFQVSL